MNREEAIQILGENKCLGTSGYCCICTMTCPLLMNAHVTSGQLSGTIATSLKSQTDKSAAEVIATWAAHNQAWADLIERCTTCGRCTRSCPCKNDAAATMGTIKALSEDGEG